MRIHVYISERCYTKGEIFVFRLYHSRGRGAGGRGRGRATVAESSIYFIRNLSAHFRPPRCSTFVRVTVIISIYLIKSDLCARARALVDRFISKLFDRREYDACRIVRYAREKKKQKREKKQRGAFAERERFKLIDHRRSRHSEFLSNVIAKVTATCVWTSSEGEFREYLRRHSRRIADATEYQSSVS